MNFQNNTFKLPRTVCDRCRIEVLKSNLAPQLKYIKHTENAFPPVKGYLQSAGYDLKSAYDYTVPKHGRQLIMTDLTFIFPDNCYGRIAPRSGLALKHFLDVGAGVIDKDYRGNVGVLLINHSDEDFTVNRGDRIAQLICEVILYPELKQVTVAESTGRNLNGFGSTGDTKIKHRATNPIVELIARKRAQLVRLAQTSCKRDANSDTSDSGAAVSSCRKHSCKRKRRRPRSSSSGSEGKSSPQSLPSTPGEKRKKLLVWDDENSSDSTDQGALSNINVKEPSTSSETPDSGIAMPQISTSSKHKPKSRSHRNYRRHLPDSDSD